MHLSYSLAELQVNEIPLLWEAPTLFEDLETRHVWIVYGKKGSGKSTIVTFMRKSWERDGRVFTIRPRRNVGLFQQLIRTYRDVDDLDPRLAELGLVSLFDYLLHVKLMRGLVDVAGPTLPGSTKEKIYNFLRAAKLIRGSVLHRAIRYLGKFTSELPFVPDIDAILEESAEEYAVAKDAVVSHIVDKGEMVHFCIDDIDDINFSFTPFDRIFINSLIAFVVNANTNFAEDAIPIRVLLTCPSEIFFHSQLWGGDWVGARARCLNWRDQTRLQNLVNKRIAREFDIRKSKRRHKTDIYSIASSQTWDRIFPRIVRNKNDKHEDCFSYILRHTFYTPRQVLALCDAIVDGVEARGIDPADAVDELGYTEFVRLIQDSVQEKSQRFSGEFVNLFGKVYGNLTQVLEVFRERPNVWMRSHILDLLKAEDAVLLRRDEGERIEGEAVVGALHKAGFLGYGVARKIGSYGTNIFDLHFSFLEEVPRSREWDILVVAPVFYDSYRMYMLDEALTVEPHSTLTLNHHQIRALANYNVARNRFPRA